MITLHLLSCERARQRVVGRGGWQAELDKQAVPVIDDF